MKTVMNEYNPPAPDSKWMRDLRATLENMEHDAVDKLEIIREMMTDDPYTFTFQGESKMTT